MDIQTLHMQNNFYRDLINEYKAKINELDKKILLNERLIGAQLEDMRSEHVVSNCTLCMGGCTEHE